jgi:hypothetical protein
MKIYYLLVILIAANLNWVAETKTTNTLTIEQIVQGKYIQIEDIRAVIFNGIDGLNLYN